MFKFSRHIGKSGLGKLGFSLSVAPPGPIGAMLDFNPELPPRKFRIGVSLEKDNFTWELGPLEGGLVPKMWAQGRVL